MPNGTRNVCVVTGTRAEYGLLRGLMSEIRDEPALNLQLIVTGMHLSPEFGLTHTEIVSDGFKIDHRVEMLVSSDTPVGVTKSMGLSLVGFADAIANLSPDLMILLGDRYEVFCAASAAMIARVPIAHLHGGESTEGLIDEAIRHSITKMAHLHFPAAELYKNRIIQLGECPTKVFNFGAMAVDNIKNAKVQSRLKFEESIEWKLADKNLIITYHPVTLEKYSEEEQFSNLLDALLSLENTNFIFTKSNSDMGGRAINKMIDSFVAENSLRAISFNSMGQRRYISAMFMVDGVVGNSSSGIIEAPYVPVGSVNIGDRQRGRIAASSVIHCGHAPYEIKNALAELFSTKFRSSLASTVPFYGQGNAAKNIVGVIKNCELSDLLKKKFYDLEPG